MRIKTIIMMLSLFVVLAACTQIEAAPTAVSPEETAVSPTEPAVAVPQKTYTAFQLRTALDPLSELNAADESQSFTVELVDGDGNRAQLTTEPIPFPVGKEVENNFLEGGRFSSHIVLRVLRLPLAEFTAVNLSNITEIALIFDQTPNGDLFTADLEFLKSGAE